MKRTLSLFILLLIFFPAASQERTVVRDTLPGVTMIGEGGSACLV